MGQRSRFLRESEGGGLLYWCQGCESLHRVNVGEGPGPRWGWNGDVDKPVFTPSVLTQWDHAVPPVTAENLEQWKVAPWPQTKVHEVCHTFIGCNGAQPGEVIFLGDCTHSLAGQTLPFPQLPDYLQDEVAS